MTAGGAAHVNDLYQPGVVVAPTLQIVRAANQINDNDSIGHSYSSVSAGTESTIINALKQIINSLTQYNSNKFSLIWKMRKFKMILLQSHKLTLFEPIMGLY